MNKKYLIDVLMALAIIMVAIFIVTIIVVTFWPNSWENTNFSALCCLWILLLLAIWLNKEKTNKRVWYVRKNVLKENMKMEKAILDRLIDKKVIIHTMDDYIDGTIEEVTETTVVVKKYNKDGTIKETNYVNANMIMTINEKNK